MVTGLLALGSAFIAKAFKFGGEVYHKKADQKHELKLLELQKDIEDKETERADIIADGEAFKQSYKHDSSFRNVSQWVDNYRAMVRPNVTYFLIGLVAIIYIVTTDVVQEEMITASILDLCGMAIGWWFGRRS